VKSRIDPFDQTQSETQVDRLTKRIARIYVTHPVAKELRLRTVGSLRGGALLGSVFEALWRVQQESTARLREAPHNDVAREAGAFAQTACGLIRRALEARVVTT